MPSTLSAYTSAPVGAGLLPNPDGKFDVTVVAPGNMMIIGVHVVSWIVAIVLSFMANGEYRDLATAKDPAKGMMLFQCIMSIVSLLGAAAHASFMKKPGPIVGVFLLASVIFTTVLSGANLAVSVVDSSVYNMALFACIFVTLSSCMVISFYIYSEMAKKNAA